MSSESIDTWENVERRYPRRKHTLRALALSVLVLLVFGLLLFAYLPLSKRASALELGVSSGERQLAQRGIAYSNELGAGLRAAEKKLAAMRELADAFEARTEFYSDADRFIEGTFRVLEFEQRRFTVYRNLLRLADSKGIRMPENFASVLPAYVPDTATPEQTWLQLEFFFHAVEALLNRGRNLKVSAIEVLPARLHHQAMDDIGLLELRLRIHSKGKLEQIAPFLNASASLDNGEVSEGDKAAYFIERINLRSATGGTDELVELEVQVSGFAHLRTED